MMKKTFYCYYSRGDGLYIQEDGGDRPRTSQGVRDIRPLRLTPGHLQVIGKSTSNTDIFLRIRGFHYNSKPRNLIPTIYLNNQASFLVMSR